MECQECGYVLDPFQKECPKCAVMKQLDRDEQAAATGNVSDQDVLAALDNAMPTIQRRVTHEAARQRYEPELGWPLTVSLWVCIGLNSLYLLLVTLSVLGVQLDTRVTEEAFREAGSGGLLLSFFPALNLWALIAMLRCQRWGLYVFGIFGSLPAVFVILASLALGPAGVAVIVPLFLPGILVFIFGAMRWDAFD